MRPSIMTGPDRESALVALKNPPMLQPKASMAPAPIRIPPMAPFASSPGGGTRMANSRARRAAASAPAITPRSMREPE